MFFFKLLLFGLYLRSVLFHILILATNVIITATFSMWHALGTAADTPSGASFLSGFREAAGVLQLLTFCLLVLTDGHQAPGGSQHSGVLLTWSYLPGRFFCSPCQPWENRKKKKKEFLGSTFMYISGNSASAMAQNYSTLSFSCMAFPIPGSQIFQETLCNAHPVPCQITGYAG